MCGHPVCTDEDLAQLYVFLYVLCRRYVRTWMLLQHAVGPFFHLRETGSSERISDCSVMTIGESPEKPWLVKPSGYKILFLQITTTHFNVPVILAVNQMIIHVV